MTPTVSIMVLPTGSNDALPQILLERNGVWQDMSPALEVRMLLSVPELRQRIDTLLVEMMSQIRSNVAPSWAAMRAACKKHYMDIVPSGVRQALQSAWADADGDPPLLRIHTHISTDWIPWEILHDGVDFLGLRFQVARLPIMSKGPDLGQPGPRRVQRIYSFLGKNVFAHLPLTQTWLNTFSFCVSPAVQLQSYPNQNGAGGVLADFPDVDHLIDAANDGDVLHITCHGGLKDKDGQLFWTLDHTSSLTFSYHINATILSDLNLANRPLVFGNACASSLPGNGQDGLTPGFGALFFAQGALAFIGTFAPITQTMGVQFAVQFYRYLLGAAGQPGVPVGRALFETKRTFSSQGENDPSYLYYTLYGPADATFEIA